MHTTVVHKSVDNPPRSPVDSESRQTFSRRLLWRFAGRNSAIAYSMLLSGLSAQITAKHFNVKYTCGLVDLGQACRDGHSHGRSGRYRTSGGLWHPQGSAISSYRRLTRDDRTSIEMARSIARPHGLCVRLQHIWLSQYRRCPGNCDDTGSETARGHGPYP